MQYKKLDRTGMLSSILGLGTLRLPMLYKDQIMLPDVENSMNIVRTAIESGINYIDTAPTYQCDMSESIIGEAVRGFERGNILIATKCPVWEVKKSGDFRRLLESSLSKLKTDYIDCYLFHALENERWEKIIELKLLNEMENALSAGLIRHIGFSFHGNFNMLKRIIDGYDNWELCQLQYNYIDTNRQAGIEGVKYAKCHGLDVIIMEPLHGGRLASPPTQVKKVLSSYRSPIEWAFDFLYDHSEIDVVLSGVRSLSDLGENVIYANRARVGMLSSEERNMFVKAKNIYDTMANVLCTGCGYCLPCVKGINIPLLFNAFNKAGSTNYRNAKLNYTKIEITADSCIHCKKCEPKCPQKIDISNQMKKIQSAFSKPLPELDCNALKIKWPSRYKELFQCEK